jgi:hypothetical protein
MSMATTTQPTRTLTTRTGRTVMTYLTDAEAARVCGEIRSSNFARDLAAQSARGRALSPEQVTWTHILALEELARREPPEPATPALELPGIVELFARAMTPRGKGKALQSPVIVLPTADGRDVRLFRYKLSSARYPGWIGVAPEFGTGPQPMHGRIDREGAFHPERGTEPDPEILATLAAFHDDPAGFAGRAGRLSGRCCFCRLPLTDPRSLAVGYGKICAGHYSLPWGEAKADLRTVAEPAFA